MIVEAVCNENDINEGDIKQFTIGPGKVLLTKHSGVVSAVGAKCTHYGAPLINGAYSNGRVRCPWHNACFSTTTGDIEDFPGLDSLHRYEVSIKDGMIFVTADEESLISFRRVKPMFSCNGVTETILLLGGGASSLTCAETLRQEGYNGRVIIATNEVHPPYDRTKLSKMLSTEADKIYLRSRDFLQEKGIVLIHKKAVLVDTHQHTVTFDDDSTQRYDKLFVGTGGRPRQLEVPGAQLENIFYLRSPEDANHIAATTEEKNVVILGTGFIGMEMAAYLVGKASSVSVVGSGRSKVPFESLLGPKLGGLFFKLHHDKGVKLYMDHPLKEIKGSNGKVKSVVLENGMTISCDVVISGIGVVPSTNFLKSKLDGKGHLVVNEYMCAGDDVYGGGDIVSFPFWLENGKLINIGHWQMAQAHGRCAALAMLGKGTPFRSVPFFWSGQFGKSLRFSGYCSSYDDIVYEVFNPDEFQCVAYYCKFGKVYAVAAFNMGSKAAEVSFKLENGTCPLAHELRGMNYEQTP